MPPRWVAGVKLEDTNTVRCHHRLAGSGVENHVLIHRVGRTVVTLEFSRHVAKAVLAHVEVGAVEPMRIRILIGHKHFGHGNFVGDRSEVIPAHVTNVVDYRTLSGIEAKMELPALPIDLTTGDTEIASLALCDGNGAKRCTGIERIFTEFEDLKVSRGRFTASERVSDLDEAVFFHIKQHTQTFNWACVGAGCRQNA